MAAPKPQRQTVIFDPVKLQGMAEPLTVRIERLKGNVRQSMPLPRRDGYVTQGQGWSKDEIHELEQWALASFGGGTYAFTITDSSEPVQVMTWSQIFPTDQYPQKIPVALVSDQPMPGVPAADSYSPYTGAPPGWQMPPSPPTVNPSSFGAPMAGNHNPWPPFNSGTPSWGFPWQPQQQSAVPREDFRREAEQARLAQVEMKGQLERLAEENRRIIADAAQRAARPVEDTNLKAQLEREREERHKAELAAVEARAKAELDARLAALQPKEDPRLAQLIEDNKRLAADAQRREDDHKRERDEERRRAEDRAERDATERRHQESLAALRAEQQAAQARLETLIASQAPKTDPMMTMLMSMMDRQATVASETARLQAEAAKDAARIQAEAVKDQSRGQSELVNSLKPFMVAPMEVARLIGDATQGQHQFTSTMTRTFADAFGTMRDTYRGMMEAMQGPGESPTIRVIEGAMGSAKELIERWNANKAQSDVARMNAQRDVMTAQAAAMRPIMPHETQQVPQQPANGNGGGHTTPPPGWQAPPPVTQPQQSGLSGVMPQADNTLRKGGKTDAEWFGTALPDVLALREGIVFFIQSVSMDPPRMEPNGSRPLGIGPDQAAMLIVQAAAQITRMGVKDVLAFNYLFNEKMYDSLIDVILPEGFVKPEHSKGFRDDTLQFLYRLIQGEQVSIPMPIPPSEYAAIMQQHAQHAQVAPRPQPAAPPARAEFPPDSGDADSGQPEVVAAPPPTAVPARAAQQPVPVPRGRRQ